MSNSPGPFRGLTSARLRTRVDLSIVSIERLSFGEFVNALASPSVISVYSIQPRDGFLILQMNTEMAFILYDRLCGGPGRAPDRPREMTDIELAVLNRQILTDLIRTLEASWQEVSDLVLPASVHREQPPVPPDDGRTGRGDPGHLGHGDRPLPRDDQSLHVAKCVGASPEGDHWSAAVRIKALAAAGGAGAAAGASTQSRAASSRWN